MSVKIGTLLSDLAKKVGVDTSLPQYADLLSANFDIPDELYKLIDTKLYTDDAVKNSLLFKNYFFKQALDGVDKNLVRLMEEYQFDEDSMKEINGIASSYERIPTLVKKIKELEAKKTDANKGDRAILQEQINALNKEKATLQSEMDKKIKQIKRESDDEITNFMLMSSINSANLLTDQFDRAVMAEMAEKYITKELTNQGAKVIKKDGALKLVQASDEALDFYADNKSVSFEEFRDSVLSKNKLIAVTKPAPPTGPTNATPPNGANRPVSSSFAAALAAAQADIASAG
ncbi:hypothetical protein [Chitinophaga nivalis]|uniref:Uncharacterized protein n=1 Tax=Chitinophaga nivalis TaxID=2991709 RepID=A0ABT3IIL0_9BACT|nr:hypothetical protein [Chitinophaga nivalis]MCW3466499.1 hypothetical protein [Chitinophaga nivalis]MCW3483810.1 hypothetical protein [Chitinophaga nivalis]